MALAIGLRLRGIVKRDTNYTLLPQFFVGPPQFELTENEMFRLVQLISHARFFAWLKLAGFNEEDFYNVNHVCNMLRECLFAEKPRSVDDFDEFKEVDLLTFVEQFMKRIVRLIRLVCVLESSPTPSVALILTLESIGERLSKLPVLHDISFEELWRSLWLNAICRENLTVDAMVFSGKNYKASDVSRRRVSPSEPAAGFLPPVVNLPNENSGSGSRNGETSFRKNFTVSNDYDQDESDNAGSSGDKDLFKGRSQQPYEHSDPQQPSLTNPAPNPPPQLMVWAPLGTFGPFPTIAHTVQDSTMEEAGRDGDVESHVDEATGYEHGNARFWMDEGYEQHHDTEAGFNHEYEEDDKASGGYYDVEEAQWGSYGYQEAGAECYVSDEGQEHPVLYQHSHQNYLMYEHPAQENDGVYYANDDNQDGEVPHVDGDGVYLIEEDEWVQDDYEEGVEYFDGEAESWEGYYGGDDALGDAAAGPASFGSSYYGSGSNGSAGSAVGGGQREGDYKRGRGFGNGNDGDQDNGNDDGDNEDDGADERSGFKGWQYYSKPPRPDGSVYISKTLEGEDWYCCLTVTGPLV
ncbi:hypothetical protein HDU76_004294 [Blyttiomyces sp. JEL0837]|nr:hypothetical protein HDU76_004294 [Blyttiomyces sp. JEL0837]